MADSDEDDAGARARVRGGSCLLSCCSVVKLVFVVWMSIWQYNVISSYANAMPSAIWNGNHVAMTSACSDIFFALQRSLYASILLLLLPVVIALLTYEMMKHDGESHDLCARFCKLSLSSAVVSYFGVSVFSFVVSVNGMFTVTKFERGGEQVQDCHSLYDCGWYVFIWLVFFNFFYSCLELCFGVPIVPMPQEPLPDHYAALGVPPTATYDQIRKARNELALKWHPDKNPSDREQAERKIREVNAAWLTLSNAEKRTEYDTQRQYEALLTSGDRAQASSV
eukprot:TRINITY_DN71325_c0_g1_i1.p1 TRINITY_DN71325_c0_g1~~TRINITY_DN71325_c0_g1_i1.p1  ORF type:complete len:281 (-),score=52.82 TRINITY_DN71325_c0_g1_i1:114-956(-)